MGIVLLSYNELVQRLKDCNIFVIGIIEMSVRDPFDFVFYNYYMQKASFIDYCQI